MSELTQIIFIELLRSYNNGAGIEYPYSEQKEIAHNLAKEAYFMAIEYKRTIEMLEDEL